jgi:hypothetical protein
MFRILLIVGLILYVVYKVGTLFFRAGAASQQIRNQNQRRNFDAENQAGDKHKRKNENIKGGEYIDYEEVK